MFFVLFVLTLGISVVLIWLVWHRAKQRELQLRKEILACKYRNLKNRINPHFLFNSLSTIPEMISIDVDKTEVYVCKLIEIYRFILEHEDVDLISMEKELEFVRQCFKAQKEHGKEVNTSK